MLTNSLNQGQELPETERTAGSGVRKIFNLYL